MLLQTISTSITLTTHGAKIDTGYMFGLYMSECIGLLFVTIGTFCALPNMFSYFISAMSHFRMDLNINI